tara:strand:- start:154 stop:360 length:207 start_codon:yes stop_codon:yes gene_type:complete
VYKLKNLEIGDLIKFNYIFSNEDDQIGIVYSIKKDYNFNKIIEVLSGEEVLKLPYSLLDYTILERNLI